MEKNPYIELAECLLPEEMVEYFEVVKVEKPGQLQNPVELLKNHPSLELFLGA